MENMDHLGLLVLEEMLEKMDNLAPKVHLVHQELMEKEVPLELMAQEDFRLVEIQNAFLFLFLPTFPLFL